MYMAATRTQIYLTAEQRERLDRLRASRGQSLAELIREAVDSYLRARPPDADTALASTFGAVPDLSVPDRDEWSRPEHRELDG